VTLNFNSIPNDPRPPFRTSGLRIGTPAMTTQGFDEAGAAEVASLIVEVLRARADESVVARVAVRFGELAAAHPPYPADFAGHV